MPGSPSPSGLQVAFAICAGNAPSLSLSAKSLVIQFNITPVFLSPPSLNHLGCSRVCLVTPTCLGTGYQGVGTVPYPPWASPVPSTEPAVRSAQGLLRE